MDDLAVRAAVESAAPPTYGGMYLQGYSLDPLGRNMWDVTLKYLSTVPKSATSTVFSFDTGGGTSHMTVSRETVQKYSFTNDPAPDYAGSIGVNGDSVEGCDVVVPQFNFQITAYFSQSLITPAYRSTLFHLTGKTNLNPWFGFDAGEVLFMGAQGSTRGIELWEITFKFAGSPNRTGTNKLPIGRNTLQVEKRGWEYLWVRYADKVDGNAKALVRVPVQAYVERVYDEADFLTLGIGDDMSNGNPYRRLGPDEKHASVPRQAYNALMDDLAQGKQSQFDQVAGTPRETRNTTIVSVRNSSGATANRFGVLALGTPLVTAAQNETEFLNRITFDGTAPASASGAFAVLVEPLAAGDIGRAVLAGAVPVRLLVNDEGHGAAVPVVGATGYLQTAASGPARILWVEGASLATGTPATRNAYVLLTGSSAGGAATIDVAEADGSPSYTGITSLVVDQADGHRLSNPSPGVARLDIAAASSTETGVVNTGSQQFGTTGGIKQTALWVGGVTGGTSRVGLGAVGFAGDPLNGPDGGAVYTTVSGDGSGAAGGNRVILAARDGTSGATGILYVDSTGDVTMAGGAGARYCVKIGPTTSTGASGTDAAGSVFVGGICTTVGSGTAWGGLTGVPAYVTSLGLLSDPNADRIIFWDDSAGNLGHLEVSTGLLLTGTVLQASVGWSYDEQAQDAVGGIMGSTARIDLDYDDALGTILADLVANSVTAGYLHASASPVLFGRTTASAGAGEEITVASPLQLDANVLSLTGGPPTWTKIQKSYTDFATGSTTTDIQIHSLPAGSVLHSVIIKTQTAFSGGGILSYNFDVGKTGALTKYVSLYSGTTVGGTAFGKQSSSAGLPSPEDFGAATSIRIQATSSGANLDAATAGAVDIWLEISTLP